MRTCSKCGTKLTGVEPAGLCPKCFLEEGLAQLQEAARCPEEVRAPAGGRPERIGIAAKSEAESPETSAPVRPDVTSTVPVPVTERPGDRVGRYRLLQQIGEGGCGVVYMAEQEEPIRRRVAFKVIKLGMDTRQVVARFEAERQALALMDHPGIARVLDAGATDTGRPYFVMELVRGIKITEFCDQSKLSTDDRLELFMQVCRAIQHAHQKGIIHRDIKPSNILVALQDGRPVAKVIDFGIAKATQQRLTDKTLFTAFEAFIGTPAYMSPEQVGPGALDIDTRSDIYALGVLLYELLTGHTPFEAKTLSSVGWEEMLRIIREDQPARPSTRLRTLSAQEQTTIAGRHQAEAPKLIHQLRGDLDWIVLKALEKDRARRYDTAKDLEADIRRHLEHEPVQARPPELWYLTRKFLKRHRRPVVAGGLCCVLLAAALVGVLQQRRTHALRQAAQLAAFRHEEAEVVPQFIAASAPATEAAMARFKTCLARLTDRVRKSEGSPVDCELLARVITLRVGWVGHTIQPIQEPQLNLRVALGRWNVEGLGAVVYPAIRVGDAELRAGGWEGPANAIYLDGWGSESLITGMTKPIELRGLFSQTGKYRISGILTVQLVEAQGRKEQPLRDHVRLADYQAVGPPVRLPLPTLDCTFLQEVPPHYPVELADAVMSARIRSGVAVQDAWIDFDAEKRGRLHVEVFYPYSSDAEPKFPIALDLHLLQLEGVPSQTNTPLMGHRTYGGGGATVEEFVLALPEALTLPSGTKPLAGKISLESSREMALALGLDQFLAVPEIQKDISIELRREGTDEGKRGAQLVRQGNLAEAEALYRARLESLGAVVRADDAPLARALADLAYTLLCEGKFTEAEPLAQQCLGIQEKQMPDNWRTFAARCLLGAALLGQSRYAQAEPLLLSGHEGLSQRAKWIPPDQKRTQMALPLARLVHLYTALGQTERAVEQCRRTAESADLQLVNSLAWFLATRKNRYERDGLVATILAERVAAATNRKQPFVLDTLAAAYGEAGEFAKAVNTQREAIALLTDPKEKSDYTARLKLYQSNAPYREP